MAAGGIVSFAEGEGVSGQSGLDGTQTLEQKIARIMARSELTALQKDSLIRQIKAQEPKPETKRPESMSPVGRVSSARMPGVRGLIPTSEATNGLDVFAATNPSIAPKKKDTSGVSSLIPLSTSVVPPKEKPVVEPVVEAPVVEPVVEAPVAEVKSDAPVLPTTTGTNAPQSAGGVDMNTLMGNMGFSAEDPNAALQRGFTEADAYTGRAEKAAKYDDMLAEMAEFDAENYDPDRERRDRLKSFLMGAAGTTNIGTTFASAGAASMNLANSQRKDRRTRLMDKFNMEKDKMTTDTGLAQSGLTLGRELYSQAQQNQRSALQAGVQMRGQDLTNAQKNADRVLRKLEGDNTQAYRAATLAIEKNKVDLAALKDKNATEAARVTAANNTIFRTLQVREQISAEANALAGVEVAQTELENAELMGLEPEQVKVLQEKFDKAAALALVMTEDMMNKFGRGVDENGNPTGTSLLDAEQFAIQVLGQYGITTTIEKDSVKSTTYNE